MGQTDRVRVTWDEIKTCAAEMAEAHPSLRVRYVFALAFLWSMPMRAREDAANIALEGEVPWPPAISGTHRLQWAREWCADQPCATLKAYCLGAFLAMRPADQAAFLAHVSGRVAA